MRGQGGALAAGQMRGRGGASAGSRKRRRSGGSSAARLLRRALLPLLLAALLLTGCGGRVVLTSGFAADEVFNVGGKTGTVRELRVYLANLGNQYKNAFGAAVWDSADGAALEASARDTALARLSKVKALTLLADQKGIVLTEAEQAAAQGCAETYYASLTEADREALDVTEAELAEMYGDYALADQVYRSMISGIDPEISDDEARTVQVQTILFKTYRSDGQGGRIQLDEAQRAEKKAQADEVLAQLRGGADFAEAVSRYNEEGSGTDSFGRGERDQAYEEAAFDLDEGEISGVVETPDGYRIIKCVRVFDEAQTEANKARLLGERKDEEFGRQYDAFVSTVDCMMNEPLWEQFALEKQPETSTFSFFDVYAAAFGTEDGA